jgi:hypothetical protein
VKIVVCKMKTMKTPLARRGRFHECPFLCALTDRPRFPINRRINFQPSGTTTEGSPKPAEGYSSLITVKEGKKSILAAPAQISERRTTICARLNPTGWKSGPRQPVAAKHEDYG